MFTYEYESKSSPCMKQVDVHANEHATVANINKIAPHLLLVNEWKIPKNACTFWQTLRPCIVPNSVQEWRKYGNNFDLILFVNKKDQKCVIRNTIEILIHFEKTRKVFKVGFLKFCQIIGLIRMDCNILPLVIERLLSHIGLSYKKNDIPTFGTFFSCFQNNICLH